MRDVEAKLEDIGDTFKELGDAIWHKNCEHGKEILDLIRDSFAEKEYLKELTDILCDKIDEFYESIKIEN